MTEADKKKRMFYIEESQMWTCPRTGVWEVICVGGGASGAVALKMSNPFQPGIMLYGVGGSTSFGDYQSANGAKYYNTCSPNVSDDISSRLSLRGYTCLNYAETHDLKSGSSVVYAITDIGYGTSGVAIEKPAVKLNFGEGSSDNIDLVAIPPFPPGDIKINHIDLSENDVVPCTIGKGGDINDVTEEQVNNVMHAWSSSRNVVNWDTTKKILAQKLSSGNDGGIILKYLGTEV